MTEVRIKYADKLHPIFTKEKRLKIVLGGRASTKSTAIADYVSAKMSVGGLWCCAREQLNSIEESVHRTLLDEIERLELTGFTDTKTSITHTSGGRCFYRGLSRNISSLKSTLSGIDGLWIEEGEDLSADTLRVLTASVRLNARDTERIIKGDEDVKMPEIVITMNRGSIGDPISQKLLARAEPDLSRCGYYEDDFMMVVEINYTDIPEEWFVNSGLEQERLDDLKHMSNEEYRSKWHGEYTDFIENSLIKGEWFDACIDAHKKLGIEPVGAKVSAHDPSDGGDAKGYVMRHGILVKRIEEKLDGNVNEGGYWATSLAEADQVDSYTWDVCGMGAGLKQQTVDVFKGTRTQVSMFDSAETPDYPDQIYDPCAATDIKGQKTNKETFRNKKAQYYFDLRDAMYRTYEAVVHGKYHDPDKLISFDSSIPLLNKLRAELCRIPIKPQTGSGRLELVSKEALKKAPYNLPSPNLADSLMMTRRHIMQINTNQVRIPQPIRPMGISRRR